jgi:hypothetical protein
VASTLVLSCRFPGNGKNKNDVISRPKLEKGIPEHEAEVLITWPQLDFRDARISTCRTKAKKTESQSH